MLIFNEIEKVEVAIRAAIVNTICEQTGDKFWMTNPVHFTDAGKFANTLSLIKSNAVPVVKGYWRPAKITF